LIQGRAHQYNPIIPTEITSKQAHAPRVKEIRRFGQAFATAKGWFLVKLFRRKGWEVGERQDETERKDEV